MPASSERSLDQLIFGLTGQRAADAAPAAAPDYRDDTFAPSSTDEAEVLKRLIERRHHEARGLWALGR